MRIHDLLNNFTQKKTCRSIVITNLTILISNSLRDNLCFTSLSEPIILKKIQPDSTKFTKFTRFAETFLDSPKLTKYNGIFKDATYKRLDGVVLLGHQTHG